jgi:hypothetical protein
VFEARYSEMEWMINKNVDKDGSEQETDFVSTAPLANSVADPRCLARTRIFSIPDPLQRK